MALPMSIHLYVEMRIRDLYAFKDRVICDRLEDEAASVESHYPLDSVGATEWEWDEMFLVWAGADVNTEIRAQEPDEDPVACWREGCYLDVDDEGTCEVHGRPRMEIPEDYVVQPLQPGELAADKVTCGYCGLSWDDGVVTSITPTPCGRCPFESFHLVEGLT